MRTGGISGSKPKGRTRSRVELFTFPEQFPGPARFGEECMMESVSECAAEYVRDPLRAFEDLRDALARFEQTYDPVLIEEKLDFFTEKTSKKWLISINGQVNHTHMSVCEHLKFVFECVAMAGRREAELFGILLPKADESKVVSWISWFIESVVAWKSPTYLAIYPLWELEKKLELFKFEILTSNRFVNPNPTNATPLAEADQPREDKPPDGPDSSLMGFRSGGRVVEGLTTEVGGVEESQGDSNTLGKAVRNQGIPPSQKHLQAYVLHKIMGKDQAYTAEKLLTNQGTISRWVSNVEKWLGAGNNCPELPEMLNRLTALDPSHLELGKRLDGMSKTARPKKSED